MFPKEGNKDGERPRGHDLRGADGLLSSKKRRPRVDLSAIYSFLMSGSREGGDDLCSLVSSDRRGGNGLKLCEGKFKLGIIKKVLQ